MKMSSNNAFVLIKMSLHISEIYIYIYILYTYAIVFYDYNCSSLQLYLDLTEYTRIQYINAYNFYLNNIRLNEAIC